MAGWSREVAKDPDWHSSTNVSAPTDRTRIEPFELDRRYWPRFGEIYAGQDTGSVREVWCALVDHGERIVRWIPPE